MMENGAAVAVVNPEIGFAQGFEAAAFVSVAEGGGTQLVGEAVAIFDPSPNINETPISLKAVELSLSNGVSPPLLSFCSRKNYVIASKIPGFKLRAFDVHIVANSDEPFHITRGNMTNIAKRDVPVSVPTALEWGYAARLGVYVSTLDSLGMGSLSVSGGLCDVPQSVSASLKGEREPSNCDSGQSSYAGSGLIGMFGDVDASVLNEENIEGLTAYLYGAIGGASVLFFIYLFTG
jgi:hypothetical protein